MKLWWPGWPLALLPFHLIQPTIDESIDLLLGVLVLLLILLDHLLEFPLAVPLFLKEELLLLLRLRFIAARHH